MESWHDFYMTAGGASAALVGLLFVGVSLHLDAVVSRPDVRATARGAFQSLVAILARVAARAGAPVHACDLGKALVALALVGLLGAIRDARGMWGSSLLLGARKAVQKLGFRFAGLVLLLAVGILFLNGKPGRRLAAAVVFLLLASSAQTAWSLLIEVAEAKRAVEAKGKPPARRPWPSPPGASRAQPAGAGRATLHPRGADYQRCPDSAMNAMPDAPARPPLPAAVAVAPDRLPRRQAEPFVVMAKPVGPLCNLACDYCYYLGKTSLFPAGERYRMTEAVLDAHIRAFIEASPGPLVCFAWHGGEPTLAGLDFFRRAVELQRRHLPSGWPASTTCRPTAPASTTPGAPSSPRTTSRWASASTDRPGSTTAAAPTAGVGPPTPG